jgi:hypothetical protein
MHAEALMFRALRVALVQRRRPGNQRLLHHHHRGTQPACGDDGRLLQQHALSAA